MKKSIKSVLAKSLAVAMAFSLAGIAPDTSSDAAAKKPTVTKKISVQVGKTKTVKVTSKKKVKKTTWSLTKAGKKVVSLSKKKAKSVKVKGKKAGKATLTAKIKVGKKTYKKTCKITVTKKTGTGNDDKKTTPTPTGSTKVATPTPGGSTNTATPTPGGTTSNKVSEIKTSNGTLTVDEKDTYSIQLTDLNETTLTALSKMPEDHDEVAGSTSYNLREGSVSFTSLKDYNSGLSYYINPCTSEDQIVDISETRGDGFLGYMDGTKDMSGYDYIRVEVTTLGELNLRTYNGNDVFLKEGFPGDSKTSETYEGGWIHTVDTNEIWEEESTMSQGQTAKAQYEKRTIFIPISMLIDKGCDPSTLTGIAFSAQGEGTEVTIHSIDFVKVKYDKPVTAIEVTSNKDEIELGKAAKVEAKTTPEDATRQIVTWSSSDESIATVNFQGSVKASADKAGEVTITATATDGSGVVGTKKLVVKEPGEEPPEITDVDVLLAESGVYSSGCLENEDGSENTPVYGEDGSVTFTSSNQYNGGGMAFYFLSNKDAVDLSQYAGIQVVIEGTADAGIKLCPYTNQEPDNYLNSAVVASDYDLTMDGTEQTYTLDFAADAKWDNRSDAYAIGILYNAYQIGDYSGGDKRYAEIKVKSVKLLKKSSEEPPKSTDVDVPLTAEGVYASGCLENTDGTENTPVYGEDGSVTFTSSNQYSGGGMGFYFNEDKEAVDLSEYAGIEVVIEGTKDAKIKLSPYKNAEPNNYLFSDKVGDHYGLTLTGEEQTYVLDFSSEDKWADRGEAYAILIGYDAYEVGNYSDGDKRYAEIKVKSVKLLKTLPTE